MEYLDKNILSGGILYPETDIVQFPEVDTTGASANQKFTTRKSIDSRYMFIALGLSLVEDNSGGEYSINIIEAGTGKQIFTNPIDARHLKNNELITQQNSVNIYPFLTPIYWRQSTTWEFQVEWNRNNTPKIKLALHGIRVYNDNVDEIINVLKYATKIIGK